MIRSTYRYRRLIFELVIRDIVLRYRGSVLGFLWTLLNPLLFMLVYTLVFSVYMRVGIARFPVFLVAGELPWIWFASSLQTGTSSIRDGGAFVTSTVFPPFILVAVPILSNLVNFLLSMPILFAIMWVFHVPVGWPIVLLPLVIGVQAALTLGFLLLLAPLNVFYRDVQQVVGIILLLTFYLTPIFYPISAIPAQYRPYVLVANPMASLVVAYQSIFYYNAFPDLKYVLYPIILSAVLLYVGYTVFVRAKDAFAEYV